MRRGYKLKRVFQAPEHMKKHQKNSVIRSYNAVFYLTDKQGTLLAVLRWCPVSWFPFLWKLMKGKFCSVLLESHLCVCKQNIIKVFCHPESFQGPKWCSSLICYFEASHLRWELETANSFWMDRTPSHLGALQSPSLNILQAVLNLVCVCD